MISNRSFGLTLAVLLPWFLALDSSGQTGNLGLFQGESEIGAPARKGSVEFAPQTGTYLIAGGGENMWFTNDALHFVWKKISGDFSLAAEIQWPAPGGNAHRKACILLRQSLAADSAYADVAVHGDGLTSLQYRENPGELTREIQANVSSPARVCLEKHGNYVSLSLASAGEPLHPAGAACQINFKDEFYLGFGVCAHDNQALEKARFTKVALTLTAGSGIASRPIASTLEVIPIGSKDRRAVYYSVDRLESPNWSPDGLSLYYNSKGRIFRLPVIGGTPQVIATGSATNCTLHHGISPDGSTLAITHEPKPGISYVYTVPVAGGSPRQVTRQSPSHWLSWAPDGASLLIAGARNGDMEAASILAINLDGTEERPFSLAAGINSNPDYAADGKSIFFQSSRTGLQQIWRMKAVGSNQEQMTGDATNNYESWCPHPSPDGKWIAFLAVPKSPTRRDRLPINEEMRLMLMPASGGPAQLLCKFLGGQGTLDAPSWSPDSKRIAFISHQYIHP